MRTAAPKRGRQLIDFSHYDFGGINIQDSPQKLADSDLTQAVNMYLSTEGDILLRRGIAPSGANISNAGYGARGMYRFYQEISAGAVSTFKQTVKQVGSSLYDADTGALIGTAGQLGVGAQSMSCERMFDPNRSGGTDILVICVGPSGGPFAYDGTSLYPLAAGPTSVAGARWCKLINAVLFFGGIPSQPNLVVASYINQPENTPGYNTFAMSAPVVGFGTLGEGLQTTLVVGHGNGITLINGFTPNSFSEQEIPCDGPQAGRAMLTVDGVLYYIGNFAIYRYDGSSFTEISRKVRPWILNDPTQPDFPMNGDRTASWAMYWNRRIYFWYASNPNGPAGLTNTALVWDVLREGWTIYQSGQAFGAACLLNAPNDPDPATFKIQDQQTGLHYSFDVYADAQFSVSDNGEVIKSIWLSKFFKIGDPGTEKRLLRMYPEIFAYNFNGAFMLVTDYGLSTVVKQALTAGVPAAEWDQAKWDQAKWSSANPGYFKPRIDVNVQGEAFAFGAISPNPTGAEWDRDKWDQGTFSNATVATYRCMGITGRYSQVPKN